MNSTDGFIVEYKDIIITTACIINMFVDINNKQKKVTQNIIIELNATLKWGSPKPKEMLESLTYDKLIEGQVAEAENIQRLLKTVPMPLGKAITVG